MLWSIFCFFVNASTSPTSFYKSATNENINFNPSWSFSDSHSNNGRSCLDSSWFLLINVINGERNGPGQLRPLPPREGRWGWQKYRFKYEKLIQPKYYGKSMKSMTYLPLPMYDLFFNLSNLKIWQKGFRCIHWLLSLPPVWPGQGTECVLKSGLYLSNCSKNTTEAGRLINLIFYNKEPRQSPPVNNK